MVKTNQDILRIIYVVTFISIIFTGYILFTSPTWAKAATYYAYFTVIGIAAAFAYPRISGVKFSK